MFLSSRQMSLKSKKQANIACSGRAGAAAPPKGIQPLRAFSTFGIFLPNPPPAANACR